MIADMHPADVLWLLAVALIVADVLCWLLGCDDTGAEG